jgi:Tfp pilus assembly protein PilF
MRIAQSLLALFAITMLSSCATVPETPSSLKDNDVTANMVLNASPLLEGQEPEDLSQIDILELTPGMITFLNNHIGDEDNRYARLRLLLFAVIGEGQFDLVYDDSTRTAMETFRDQRGNCLSFTNMFVAMARYLDLDASYQEVKIPPDWSLSGHSFLFSQHVNVFIDLENNDQRVVDFNMANFNVNYERRVISDQRARAHYFSNMGVEYMLAGDTAQAFANFREGISEDKSYSPAWVNLGILYRREGYPDYAEAAYLKGVEIDRFNLVAMSNLSSLYHEQGHTELAEHYRGQVESHRMRNPYYRYQVAQADFVNGDYDAAIDNLKFAVRERKNEDSFYMLMSLNYLMKGDREAAQHWMKKAEEVAEQAADKQKYSSKYELLMGQQKAGGY